MRFLQLVAASGNATPQSPEQRARAFKAIKEAIASGQTLATGGLGNRATAAARIVKKDGEVTVDESPTGAGWMASGGYSLTEFPSKEAAIAYAKLTLDMMGDATVELIAVGEMHPPAGRAPGAAPSGVVPYLTVDGASEVSAFYQRAFGAREIARMPAEDGKRLLHCHLEINGGGLMLSDNFPEYGHPPVARSPSDTMQLVVSDGQAWWSRAITAGCTEKMPFAVAPWGDRYGQLTDPFGVTWAISSPAS
jgi:PhnB protein